MGLMRLGLLGLGHMGEPIAANLVRAGVPLTVWNRTREKAARLETLGAQALPSAAEVFARCDVVIMMLANAAAIDDVLGRDGDGFGVPVGGTTVVNMGTVSPHYSQRLGEGLQDAGARYVECPVSGSRVPAEAGQLVAMLAGDPEAVALFEPFLAPVCSSVFRCGQVPNALRTKLAVNVFLISMVAGLAESVRFAEAAHLDLEVFGAILDAGPMASPTSRTKLAMLLAGDHEAQAAIHDVHTNSRLILDAARGFGATSPLLTVCEALLRETQDLGLADADMVAVLEAIRARDGASSA